MPDYKTREDMSVLFSGKHQLPLKKLIFSYCHFEFIMVLLESLLHKWSPHIHIPDLRFIHLFILWELQTVNEFDFVLWANSSRMWWDALQPLKPLTGKNAVLNWGIFFSSVQDLFAKWMNAYLEGNSKSNKCVTSFALWLPLTEKNCIPNKTGWAELTWFSAFVFLD